MQPGLCWHTGNMLGTKTLFCPGAWLWVSEDMLFKAYSPRGSLLLQVCWEVGGTEETDAGREVTEGSGESLQEARSTQRRRIQKKLAMKVQDEERKGRLEVKGQYAHVPRSKRKPRVLSRGRGDILEL